MKLVLITGASGLIGRALAQRLALRDIRTVLAVRTPLTFVPQGARYVQIGEIGPQTDWSTALQGCDAVVHLAAQTPMGRDSDARMNDVNALGTARLADQCRQAGVRRLVFMSSILAVSGNSADALVDDRTMPSPQSAYGASKLAAEGYVAGFARSGGIGISLRPPLVYHNSAKGNWAALQRLAASGLPLPFAGISNRRSLMSRDNLVEALIAAISVDDPPSGAYCLDEGPPLALPEMLACLRQGMEIEPRLFAFPASILKFALSVVGKGQLRESLFGNLEVSGRRFQQDIGWTASQDTQQGLRDTGSECMRLAGRR